ncbi:MAG: hypothetical protein M3211_01605 [Actinomycetota bacterium]|nr:hypothetical protein [Actinomycetota bacterium]
MPTIQCPSCAADDEALSGRRETGDTPEGTIIIHCSRCGAEFPRLPEPSCPRCGSKDVDRSSYEGWESHDLDELRENPATTEWSYVERFTYRCQRCYREWTGSGLSRPYGRPNVG